MVAITLFSTSRICIVAVPGVGEESLLGELVLGIEDDDLGDPLGRVEVLPFPLLDAAI